MVNDAVTYVARVVGEIPYRPGTWNGVRVGVFRSSGETEVQVGEYERNYPSLLRTFSPLHVGGRDLALYSPDYTCTRLLELPSCRDIGGEEPTSAGFCPADFFVPSYIDMEWCAGDQPPRRLRRQQPKPAERVARKEMVTWPAEDDKPARAETRHYTPIGPLSYHPFGFVAGCVWGDDSSWKIQYLDLSRASEGVVLREERFGHIELPNEVTLERAIDLVDYQDDPDEDYAHWVQIAVAQRFDLRDGRPINPLGG